MRKYINPPLFVLLTCFLSALFFFLLPDFNFIPFPYNFAGIIISFAGFVLMGKTHDLFKKYNTPISITKSTYLITEGPFAYSRNPMYLGMFLFLLGISICFMNLFSILSAIAFLITINFIYVRDEEKLMQESFGIDYISYKNRVRKWI